MPALKIRVKEELLKIHLGCSAGGFRVMQVREKIQTRPWITQLPLYGTFYIIKLLTKSAFAKRIWPLRKSKESKEKIRMPATQSAS